MSPALLAPAASLLQEAHPRLVVRVDEVEPTDAFDLLLSGDTDLAIIEATPDCPPPGDTRFELAALLDDPMDLLVPTGHRFVARQAVALADADSALGTTSASTSSEKLRASGWL